MIQRLYKKIDGKIAFWEAEAKDGILTKRWAKCIKDGKVQERDKSFVGKGKQGRSDIEQAEFMLLSEVNEHVDAGYVFEISHCEWPVTNSLGFAIPMLATDRRKMKQDINYADCALGPKLNGHRMLLGLEACPNKVADSRYKADGEVTLYSRGSQKIDLPHILEEALPFAAKTGLLLDGEVYHHGTPLQKIKSMVAHKDEQLSWHLYDLVSPEPHGRRRRTLEARVPKRLKYIRLNPSHIVDGEDQARELHKTYVSLGYEGTILRWGVAPPYHEDKRSLYLVKQKDFIDEEFEVIDMVFDEPRKAPKGTVLLCPSFIVANNNDSGTSFKVTVHGDMYQKDKIGKEGAKKWRGRTVTLSYQERSEDGIPTICTCLGEREDL